MPFTCQSQCRSHPRQSGLWLVEIRLSQWRSSTDRVTDMALAGRTVAVLSSHSSQKGSGHLHILAVEFGKAASVTDQKQIALNHLAVSVCFLSRSYLAPALAVGLQSRYSFPQLGSNPIGMLDTNKPAGSTASCFTCTVVVSEKRICKLMRLSHLLLDRAENVISSALDNQLPSTVGLSDRLLLQHKQSVQLCQCLAIRGYGLLGLPIKS